MQYDYGWLLFSEKIQAFLLFLKKVIKLQCKLEMNKL